MKKLLYLIISLLFIGCSNISNTPTNKVEDFFSKYQMLDSEVITELENSINSDVNLNEEDKKEYINIMKNHYQNLKYEIKDEVIDGDTATVTVLIEVLDYSKILYGEEYDNNDLKVINKERLKKMKDNKEKVYYTLEINLSLIDKEWRINDLSDTDYLKISGLYGY